MPFKIHDVENPDETGRQKPCRTCTDFKTWMKMQRGSYKKNDTAQNNIDAEELNQIVQRKDCPLDKDELGRSTWNFLHTMAAYYPDDPTKHQMKDMEKFFSIFSNVYPCEPCAADFKESISKNPPKTGSQSELSKWLCDMHNIVNVKLGKKTFDCSKVNERWRDGPPDGSCG